MHLTAGKREVFTMGESMITSFDGTKLYLKKETAADNKAVIVIVHGLCEHQGRYDYFAEKLHEAGIGTYRFDHRGHGRSEGEETFYSDFNELLDDTNVVVDMAIEENPDIPFYQVPGNCDRFFFWDTAWADLRFLCTEPNIRTKNSGGSLPVVR